MKQLFQKNSENDPCVEYLEETFSYCVACQAENQDLMY